MSFEILTGDVLERLPDLEPDSFDAVFCDPPYGLSFMGKAWDHGVPGAPIWRLVADALKPGAPLLAFGGTRTHHRLMVAIEDAGFEIRDCLMWLYGSGFPKSHNFGNGLDGWSGYGTALKPAWEPVVLAMKPLDGTFAENALTHGVAGLNVDGCRIETDWQNERGETWLRSGKQAHPDEWQGPSKKKPGSTVADRISPAGRWPANVLLDPESARLLDEQSGDVGAGGASRFYYCAKASRGEREAGLDGFDERDAQKWNEGGIKARREAAGLGRARNVHPTVKPIDLCRYLATLILPPKRDTPRRLLVPFSGSGSEMIGALVAGWDEVVGIELLPEYVEIAEARLRHWLYHEPDGAQHSLLD